MAIFGIGADWDGDHKLDEFIADAKACIGWWPHDTEASYNLLKTIKAGDFIYIKSTPPGELRIKAVGVVIDSSRSSYDNNAMQNNVFNCLNVKWLWHGKVIILSKNSNPPLPTDKYNVRNNTLYEEFNPDIHRIILQLSGII